MILIAESGSTKTDWRVINKDGQKLSFETIGFNPYFISSASVLNELTSSKLVDIKKDVKQVFFYGAGCSTAENCRVIAKPLSTFFDKAKIEVDHDMLAAGRATCGRGEGMVAILGTGSNSCLYNGYVILENVTALGYLLGDNGSGADIGKTFIKAYLGNELPSEIEEDFKKQYKLSTSDILDSVYKEALPNRFLAGFSLFVHQHINNATMQKIVEDRFDLFFKKNICKYSDYENQVLHFVGSIAYMYQDLLHKTAKNYNVKIGKIIKHPIEDLVNYHISNS
jgi:N-acetylglucosamine kinase-like BadF-type ATPase